MYSQNDFNKHLGKWATFRTPWGNHRGIVEKVRHDSVLFKMSSDHASKWSKISSESHEPDVKLAGFFGGRDGCFPHHHDCFPRFGGGIWFWIWIPIVFILFFSCFCW